jgi:hypothetical protein
MRLGEILDLFSWHFLKMAEKYIEYGNIRHAQLYLSHVDNLAMLMQEKCEAYGQHAEEIQQEIQKLAARQPRAIKIVPAAGQARPRMSGSDAALGPMNATPQGSVFDVSVRVESTAL